MFARLTLTTENYGCDFFAILFLQLRSLIEFIKNTKKCMVFVKKVYGLLKGPKEIKSTIVGNTT